MDDWVDSSSRAAEPLPVQGFEPSHGHAYGHLQEDEEVCSSLDTLASLHLARIGPSGVIDLIQHRIGTDRTTHTA